MTNYQMLLISTLSYLRIKMPLGTTLEKNKYYVKDMLNGKLSVKISSKFLFLEKKISFIEDFQIIDYCTTSSGFCGYCLRSPEGEVVFGFSGTNIFDIRDLYTDFKIAIGKEISNMGQFRDAYNFVKYNIYGYGSNKSVYFTGHSLGGGLAQYSAYSFSVDFDVKATTFNGVGVSQNLTNSLILKDKDLMVDYSFMDDIVGNFGKEFGLQKKIYVGKKYFKNFTHHGIVNFYNYFYPDVSILTQGDGLPEIGAFYTEI